jgi:hypothetical protein
MPAGHDVNEGGPRQPGDDSSFAYTSLVSLPGKRGFKHSRFQSDMLAGWDERHAMLKIFDDTHHYHEFVMVLTQWTVDN